MVPWARLELARLAAPPPQDGVSTNSTTRASFGARGGIRTRKPLRAGDFKSPVYTVPPLSLFGAQGEIRTHTVQVLNLLPLPIALLGLICIRNLLFLSFL